MFSAFLGHLVGDFILQNDWMAARKKSSSFVCAIHCLIWTSSVMLFASWPLWTCVPLFLTHFVQDRTQIIAWWMDKVGQKGFRTGPLAPWSIIIVDNVWHIIAIWIIAKSLTT